jgi:hypothetical protein
VQVTDTAANNLVVEYAVSPEFTGAATTAPEVFAGNKARVSFTVGSGNAVYYRWHKRDAANNVVSTGRTHSAAGAWVQTGHILGRTCRAHR